MSPIVRLPRLGHLLGVVSMVALLAGCATAPTDPEERADYVRTNDPIEPTNRAIFDANIALDTHALKPAAKAYREYVPVRVQSGLHNAASNLGDPEVALNQLLQGHAGNAWGVVQRFTVNSTLGLGGLFDVATDWGLKHQDADFGQTLGTWGVSEGPFVELLLFGPSNPRDALGTGLTFALNPLGLAAGPPALFTVTEGATEALDKRAEYIDALDDLQRNSIDFYAALRSAYRQNRTHQIDIASATGDRAQVAAHSPADDIR